MDRGAVWYPQNRSKSTQRPDRPVWKYGFPVLSCSTVLPLLPVRSVVVTIIRAGADWDNAPMVTRAVRRRPTGRPRSAAAMVCQADHCSVIWFKKDGCRSGELGVKKPASGVRFVVNASRCPQAVPTLRRTRAGPTGLVPKSTDLRDRLMPRLRPAERRGPGSPRLS